MELNGPGKIIIIKQKLGMCLESCKGSEGLLLVSVVVTEAPDVVGGNVMDGAKHVLPVPYLQTLSHIKKLAT